MFYGFLHIVSEVIAERVNGALVGGLSRVN